VDDIAQVEANLDKEKLKKEVQEERATALRRDAIMTMCCFPLVPVLLTLLGVWNYYR
jgi:hypothetical protein